MDVLTGGSSTSRGDLTYETRHPEPILVMTTDGSGLDSRMRRDGTAWTYATSDLPVYETFCDDADL